MIRLGRSRESGDTEPDSPRTFADGALLSARDVSWSVAGREIVRSVDIDVHPGEVLGLIGPNGAGKSSLLGALTGELDVRGDIVFDGRPLGRYSAKELARRRSVMLQHVDVAFPYLVRDVVEMGRAPWPLDDPAADTALVDAALAATDVVHLQDRDITTLSGGERARVALARVVAQNTDLVFLDEPTAALDIAHQMQTMGLCRELAEAGRALVVVLHDINMAARYCDRIVLMDAGAVVADGTPRDVCNARLLSEVYRWPISVHQAPQTGDIVIRPDNA